MGQGSTMAKISVVIPSRLQGPRDDPSAPWFVERAVACVRGQSIFRKGFVPEIIIGVDPGMAGLAMQRLGHSAMVAEAAVGLQSAALNAAIAKVSGDHAAFLEDDDLWAPDYLERALSLFAQFQFASSTHLERTVDGLVVRIVDYPTPSSWVMPRATLDRVGGFDESYRWHLDSEWIGRLNEQRIARVHFVEATAPIEIEAIRSTRPNLWNILVCAAEFCSFSRHESPWPLVMRTVHPGSGMAQIECWPLFLKNSAVLS
jgi:hypothetical protein